MSSARISAKIENPRKIWLSGLALMIIGLSGSNLFGMHLMGPPTAELEKGMFGGGIEYSLSEMDLDLIEGELSLYSGDELASGSVESITINDFKVDTLYATVGYGIFENCEAFLRIGAAKSTFGDSLWEEQEDFSGNVDIAFGGGFKATFYKGFAWKVGGVVQINRSELDGEINSSAWEIPQPQFAEISTTEMQIALGAKYLYSGWLSIYGGPFAYFISGDFDYNFTRLEGGLDTGNFSWEINEGPIYGGYIGAQMKIFRSGFANIEYQHTSNATVLGASVMMRY